MPAAPTPSAQLLHLLPNAVVQTDARWTLTYLTPAWQAHDGHAEGDALGSSLLDCVHPDDTGTLRAGMPVFRLRCADGGYRWTRLPMQPEVDAHERVLSR